MISLSLDVATIICIAALVPEFNYIVNEACLIFVLVQIQSYHSIFIEGRFHVAATIPLVAILDVFTKFLDPSEYQLHSFARLDASHALF